MTTIFLAGAEVPTLHKALVDNGVKRILFSYYYIMEMRLENTIAQLQAAYPGITWFLDSGAFTYYAKWKTDQARLPPYKEYVQRFFDYIDMYGKPYHYIAEPDLDVTGDITEEEVDAWREEMFDRWPDYNILPVWHESRGFQMWTWYVNDARVRALAVGSGSSDVGMLRRLVLEAHNRGKPVHGFAMTKVTKLRSIPFDSVDSTTWVLGQKYGTMYVFRNNKFIVLPKMATGISEKARGVGGKGTGSKRVRIHYGDSRDKRITGKEKRRLYATYFRNIGCDPKKIAADDVAEVRKANIIAWRNLSARLEYMRKRTGQNFVDLPAGEGRIIQVPRAVERPGVVTTLFGSSRPKEREHVPAPRPRER